MDYTAKDNDKTSACASVCLFISLLTKTNQTAFWSGSSSNSILIKVIIKAHFDQDQRTGWSVWLGTMATWPRRASSRYSSHPTSSWRLSTRTRMGLSRRWMWCVVRISIKLVVRVDFHFIHDVPDNSFSPEMRTSYLFSDFTLKVVHFATI